MPLVVVQHSVDTPKHTNTHTFNIFVCFICDLESARYVYIALEKRQRESKKNKVIDTTHDNNNYTNIAEWE